jgi:hypothetical protein
LLDAAASLVTGPALDAWSTHTMELSVTAAPAPALGHARLVLAQTSETPAVALGDPLQIELGYEDELGKVFTGQVASIRKKTSRELEVLLATPAHLLASFRQNASFEQQSLGDLARTWASEAGTDTNRIDAGPSFPFLAVDDRRSAWEWLGTLARLSGLFAFIDVEGKLNLAEPEASASSTFEYGVDLLSFELTERAPFLGAVTMIGEGAAGSQGAEAWSRLLKKADGVRHEAGSGAPARLRQSGALRSLDTAQKAAEGIAARAAAAELAVSATVLGRADLGVLSRFELRGVPEGAGQYIALSCRHGFDARRGFYSEIEGVRV